MSGTERIVAVRRWPVNEDDPLRKKILVVVIGRMSYSGYGR